MTDAFGGSRVQVKPPERGVFALDHDGECKQNMVQYLACLKDKKDDHHECRDLSKNYLQCRMDHDLMKKEDMRHLGFGEKVEYVRVTPPSKEAEGFIAGLGVQTGGGTKKVFKW